MVTSGKVSDGALIAVVRNMTQEPLADVAVSARRRGAVKVVGPPGVVVPSVLRPGEWGLALVVLDQPDVAGLEFEVGPSGQRRRTLVVNSAEGQTDGVTGIVGNQSADVAEDVIVDVVCFVESRPVATARLRPVSRLDPGATAPFSASIRGRPCSDWAVVASGSAAR